MRFFGFLLILASAPAAVAQQRHELLIFGSRGEASYRATHGYGAAFNETWTPHFSTQFAAGVEDGEVCVGGVFLTTDCTPAKVKTHPIDVSGRYQFVNETRWKPYIGAGVRYVRAPHLTAEARAAHRGDYPNRFDAEIVGGVEFLITPFFGVTGDAKGRVSTSDPYDPPLKISAGLNWRF